jgi:DNA-binding MarR family transcriptional regulator
VSDDTRWLSDPQLYQWMHLMGALMTLPNSFEQQLKQDSGLNFFEYSVLSGLSNAPGRALKMADLAGFAHGSQSRLSHAVTRLERAGWVQRRNCTEGSRAVEAYLTEAGLEKIVEAAPGHVREVRRLVVDVLSDEEFGDLQKILRKVLAVAGPQTLQALDDAYVQHLARTGPDLDTCLEACTEAASTEAGITAEIEADLEACTEAEIEVTSRKDAGRATPG